MLGDILGKPGAFPMQVDETKPPTRSSADSDILLEWIDLCMVMETLSNVEKAVLYMEYTLPKTALEGPRFGQNKLEELRRRCGIGMSGDEYVEIARQATRRVRDTLEWLGWLPLSRRKVAVQTFSYGGTRRRR